jgi:hypothetical protein
VYGFIAFRGRFSSKKKSYGVAKLVWLYTKNLSLLSVQRQLYEFGGACGNEFVFAADTAVIAVKGNFTLTQQPYLCIALLYYANVRKAKFPRRYLLFFN